jgi:NADPH2:quinone reductase
VAGQVPRRALQLRSLVTASQTVELSLEDVDVPAPKPDQVVVRVEAAPINPSDLGLLLAGADTTRATLGGTADRPVASSAGGRLGAGSTRRRSAPSTPCIHQGARSTSAPGQLAVRAGLAGGVRRRGRGRIETAGGKVVEAPFDIPVGRLAVVADPFGNPLVLLDLSKGRYRTDEAGRVTGVE